MATLALDYRNAKTGNMLAAAPEMLEALLLCECELSLYRQLAEQAHPEAWNAALKAARSAIGKAVVGV